MGQAAQVAKQHPITEFKKQLDTLREQGEMSMLPSTVSFDAFRNAALVAATDNPDILRTERASLFRALRRLAAAGLVPDGREAALVPFKGKAQAMPMVHGLVKLARNSGQVSTIWSEVVHEGEEFSIWIDDGERRFEHKFDPLRRAGEIVGAYAVAKMRDGAVELEIMQRDEIEKRRRANAMQGEKPSGVWAKWYPEMAKKTVMRALLKRLPLSPEDQARIAEAAAADAEITGVPEDRARPTPRRGGVRYVPEPEPETVEGEVIEPGREELEALAEAIRRDLESAATDEDRAFVIEARSSDLARLRQEAPDLMEGLDA